MDNYLSSDDRKNSDYLTQHNIELNWRMTKFTFHESFEIFLCMSDGVTFFVGDAAYSMQKGSMIIFNNTDIHKVTAASGIFERKIIYFTPQFVQDMSVQDIDLLDCFAKRRSRFCPVRNLSSKQVEEFLALFAKADYYRCNAVYGQRIYKKIVLAEILLFVNSLYSSSESLPESKNNGEIKRILPVIHFIQNNLQECLSLNFLSESFFINKYHLGTLFKKATGFTVMDYIIAQRINKARELLQKQKSVQEAGELAGFNDITHFIRTFKRIVGMTPKQYSKQYK